MGYITVSATIPYGASLRVGYKLKNSSNPFVYFSQYPAYNELPYTFPDVLPSGQYEVEVTNVCPNCSGAQFSDPTILDATIL